MHVLVTADTIGGVWVYARELVSGLLHRGVRVTLVSFGNIPALDQVRWMEGQPALDYRPTGFRLEWMQESENDMALSTEYLRSVIAEVKPDLLHFNQFCYGSLDTGLPKIVVAHSDVVGWWRAVHREEPKDNAWTRWYRLLVYRGLANATRVIAPSQAMMDSLGVNYLVPQNATVIHNGRDPHLFNPHLNKENYAVSLGRIWDAGKNTGILAKIHTPMLIYVAGEHQRPEQDAAPSAATTLHTPGERVVFKGFQGEHQLRHLLARARVYIATSIYEPFGLAPVEAALSRCAILASDIPSFREIWGEDALYFVPNDPKSLEGQLRRLADDPELATHFGLLAYRRALGRFSSVKMVEKYLELYRSLVSTEAIAA